jgi:hypothetical protein
VDRAVVDWFKATRSQNIPVSGALIKEKALELAGRLRESISILGVPKFAEQLNGATLNYVRKL